MPRSTSLLLLGQALVVALLAALSPAPAHAQNTPPAVDAVDAPAPGPAASQSDGTAAVPATRIKATNAAGLSVEMSPELDVSVGTNVSFRVSTRKEGYLLLVDVDANGKVTQIYPNPLWLTNAPGGRQRTNLVKPGKAAVIPDPTDQAGFAFVASAPLGTAMVVALLSDRPVQMIDLPDVPVALLGQADALDHLSTLAHELRIPSGEAGRLQQPRWSLDAKFYSVR